MWIRFWKLLVKQNSSLLTFIDRGNKQMFFFAKCSFLLHFSRLLLYSFSLSVLFKTQHQSVLSCAGRDIKLTFIKFCFFVVVFAFLLNTNSHYWVNVNTIFEENKCHATLCTFSFVIYTVGVNRWVKFNSKGNYITSHIAMDDNYQIN